MLWDSVYLSTYVLTEALYEKKQSIVTYNTEVDKLQARVEKMESASTEKDACIAEYEAIIKKSEGEVIWWKSTIRNEIWQEHNTYILARGMSFL